MSASGSDTGAEHFSASLAALAVTARVGLWEYEPATGRALYNAAFEEMAGISLPPELSAHGMAIHPDDAARVEEKLAACLRGGAAYAVDFRLVRPDGSFTWVVEHGAATEQDGEGRPARVAGMLYDITASRLHRIEMERELAQREYVANLAGLSSWTWEAAGDRFTYSEEFWKLYDLVPVPQGGSVKSLEALFGAAGYAGLRRGMLAYMETGEGVYTRQVRAKTRDGGDIWLLFVGNVAERDEEGKAALMMGGLLDIDKLVQAERELRDVLTEQEMYNERLQDEVGRAVRRYEQTQRTSRAMFAGNPHLNALFNDKFEVIDCNPAAISYFGFADKRAFLDGFANLMNNSTPDVQPSGRRSVHMGPRLAIAARTGIDEFETELMIRGKPTPLGVTLKRIPYEENFAIVGYAIDLTSLKEAERELSTQERLLRAVCDAAALLMAQDQSDLTDAVCRSLQILGESVDSDRAYIWRNRVEEGRLCCSPAGEWFKSGVSPREGFDRVTVFYDEILPDWRRYVEQEGSFQQLSERFGAALLMGDSDNFAATVHRALEYLGRSVGTDRAYIWRNSMVNGRFCCTQVAEWYKSRPSNLGSVPVAIPYDDFVPDWRELVKAGSLCLTRDELDEGLAAFPSMQDVQSLMIIPIHLEGEFWGFIGFDDVEEARVYSKSQEDILTSGGLVMASAIARDGMTQSLIEAREEALASVNAKSDFLSRMSHEIRTPMNAIIGMTTIAQKTDSAERIRQCLDKIEISSRQLLGIINDVLDMSKIDANKLEISEGEFDFEKMMENVFNVVQVRLEEKRQDFHFDFGSIFPRHIISDELRLSQVLINLLTNAVKFTPECGRITLKVRETPLDADHSTLHIEVVDTGIGIPADRLPRLFQSFEQADGSITRQYGGTGLGLAISRRIIRLMGGDIWVESEEGKGSAFIFEIEVGWGERRREGLAQRSLRRDLRILVVDDAEDVRDYFQSILQSFQLSCHTAANGQEAIGLAGGQKEAGASYDIVFIDWNMPGATGAETARELRRILGEEAILVMISVSEWSEIEAEAGSLGLTHYLAKPVLPSVLYNTLVALTEQTLVTPAAEEDWDARDWCERTLLLVEDIEINREIVISILEETGAAIECAADGRQAVEMFTADPGRYDLILMDVQMPVLDGLGATRAIRALDTPRGQAVPIVAMTANAFKEDEKACLEAGMNSHVAKPLEVDELFGTLAAYLDARA